MRGCNLCADTQWLYNLIYFIEKEWDVMEKRVEFAVRAVNLKGAFSKQQFHNSFLLILSSTCPRLRALQLGLRVPAGAGGGVAGAAQPALLLAPPGPEQLPAAAHGPPPRTSC